MKKYKVWELPRENRKRVKLGTVSKWCNNKCGLSYTACMRDRRIDVKENLIELQALEKLSVKPLFTPYSPYRINPFMTGRISPVREEVQ